MCLTAIIVGGGLSHNAACAAAAAREGYGTPSEWPGGHGTHVRLGLALGYDQARDDLLIPMRWGGVGFGVDVGAERVRERTRHTLALRLPVSLMENRFGHRAYALGGEISYALDRALRQRIVGGAVGVGGQVKWDLHDGFYQSWDEEHIYWLTAYSLGPRVVWWQDRGGFSAEMSLPLLAAVSRPAAVRLTKADPLTHISHHLFDTSRDVVLTGFPRYFALSAGVAMSRPWGNARLVFSCVLEVSTYSEPERVTVFTTRLGIARAGGQ